MKLSEVKVKRCYWCSKPLALCNLNPCPPAKRVAKEYDKATYENSLWSKDGPTQRW